MELQGEKSFKTKTIANAALAIGKLPFDVATKSLEELAAVKVIGKSVAAKVREIVETGTMKELEALLAETPPGVVEIMSIKGLGPKKVLVIWKELGIENIGELFYACNENRLMEAKGFGLKTQEDIRKSIEFKMANSGRFLYAHVHGFAKGLLSGLREIAGTELISFTGAFRRKAEIVDGLDILIGAPVLEEVVSWIESSEDLQLVERKDDVLTAESGSGVKVYIRFCTAEAYFKELVLQTGSAEHLEELSSRVKEVPSVIASEEEYYRAAGLPFIEPELREGVFEFSLAEKNALPQLICYEDLKGTLHNHSTWSDGASSLEEMARFCRDEMKIEYLGICDHSKSAFYAKGLSEERVLAQHAEIDALNAKLSPFKIFKGIESDILFDGSLDYPVEILSQFDFIVASIHSVFKMSEEKATSRLIKAIENPYTTILGHPTGRLLLSRSGYPVDIPKVIDACAANGVVIEINANPLRLDIDWRWHQYAIEKGVMLSVNPDAHSVRGFNDIHYGIIAARKGGVAAENCLNALNLTEISAFFESRRAHENTHHTI
ncbi:DNA polymerase (family 10) [Arcticibacter pallidicorallinus]|uniref:DNA polymerase (Family 10) n=2 Tax=Arcticibacter pallidicorallinus TaxID=1259464 RepID=A0A2T0UC26_9SPHI|nr:DNA polymerase (family 10) [Arcticibacter pallidicorallinus]